MTAQVQPVRGCRYAFAPRTFIKNRAVMRLEGRKFDVIRYETGMETAATPAPPPAPTPVPALRFRLPIWAIVVPILGVIASLAGVPESGLLTALLSLILGAAVLAAVYHAEVIAHRVGEPYGTLILALAVTIIEGALIVSMMLNDGESARALARDTVFAALMIVLNGIIGVCLLVGGHRHTEQRYTQYGVTAGIAMLATLAALTLVLPNFTTSEAGPVYSSKQLIFVGIISLIIYGTYVVAQTIRHRSYFLPKSYDDIDDDDIAHAHDGPVPEGMTLAAVFGLLIAALVGVVLLAKALSPAIKEAVAGAGAPAATVGIIIAALVLLPEGLAAVRAARQNRLQTSLNLAIGSALATIGLTIPVVAVVSLMLDLDLVLGLSPKSMTLLALTLFVSSLSLGTGKTTVIQGTIHLVIFAAFLFTTLVP